jgi:hypothetical protein
MAKKIALWISTLFHPIIRSPSIRRTEDESTDKRDIFQFSKPFEVGTTEQGRDTLDNKLPDISRTSSRKESIGGGIIVREQLIRDLE